MKTKVKKVPLEGIRSPQNRSIEQWDDNVATLAKISVGNTQKYKQSGPKKQSKYSSHVKLMSLNCVHVINNWTRSKCLLYDQPDRLWVSEVLGTFAKAGKLQTQRLSEVGLHGVLWSQEESLLTAPGLTQREWAAWTQWEHHQWGHRPVGMKTQWQNRDVIRFYQPGKKSRRFRDVVW